MFRNSYRLRRCIAAGLLVQLTSQLALPSISYALTAGPTAPEASSFEPVDTTDMVNLNTGDFTYNLPLLEVPGPEGGYPLSLSYHAGIQPDIEASWVGLGWTLNPGAITRNVNGYADDHHDVTQTTRDFWQGGENVSYSIGAGVGLGGTPASVSAGLSFNHNTYKGFGMGGYIGAGVGMGSDSPIGINASARLTADGYGKSSASASTQIGIGTKGDVSMAASVGLATNFQSMSVNGGMGVSVVGNSLLQTSISSGGGGSNSQFQAGAAGIRNDRAGKIQTATGTVGAVIPTPYFFIELGYNYTRYWSDETAIASTNGSLYFPSNVFSDADFNDHAYDTYRLLSTNKSIIEHDDPDYLQGGSFPEYDTYNVTAQGLSGSIRPYAFQQALYSHNRRDADGNSQVISQRLNWINPATIGFRFENDFSNRYQQENTSMAGNYDVNYYAFDPSPTHGVSGDGYEPASKRLAGSKHIEWFTNSAITSNNALGFIDTDALGFNRANAMLEEPKLAEQIGGFSITNASGITYHYALPAYSFDEVVYSTPIKRADGTAYPADDTYSRLKKPTRYAYTWYLTAITGTDYVDRNNNHIADAGDWGYWVRFSYGKWSERFGWRNPAQGFRKDLDLNIQTYSKGLKEVYYLNYITTRTHTAIFEKEIRSDAISTTKTDYDVPASLFGIYTHPDLNNATGFGVNQSAVNIVSKIDNNYFKALHRTVTTYPCRSLRLNKIYLLNNSDIPEWLNANASATSNQLNDIYTAEDYTGQSVYDRYIPQYVKHYSQNVTLQSQYGQNVFDVNDLSELSSRNTLKRLSIRIIDFKYDYSLTPNTPNSYDTFGAFKGKLTLKNVSFLGVGGADNMPATSFSYEKEQSANGRMFLSINNLNPSTSEADMEVTSGALPKEGDEGSIITFENNGYRHYCTLLKVDAPNAANSVHCSVLFLTPIVNYNINSPTAAGVFTKNPPYLAEHRDWWGMFKSDFASALVGTSENVARRTTDISNKSVDVWSLRSISSPLGSKIRVTYEGDEYEKVAFDRPNMLCAVLHTVDPGEIFTSTPPFALKVPFTQVQLERIFKVGQMIRFTGIVGGVTDVGNWQDNPNPLPYSYYPKVITKEYTNYDNHYLQVTSLSNNQIGVADPSGELTTPVHFQEQSPSTGVIGYADYYPFVTDGYISLAPDSGPKPGGGLRVAAVQVEAAGKSKISLYDYDNYVGGKPSPEHPSGGTSFEPGGFLRISDGYSSQFAPTAVCQHYKETYTTSLPKLLAVAREIPAPGVLYQTVSLREQRKRPDGDVAQLPSFWTYRFEPFTPSMIGITEEEDTATPSLTKTQVKLTDMTSRVGALRSMTHWAGPNKKLTETVNHYLHSEGSVAEIDANSPNGAANYAARLARFNYQGLIEECFGDKRYSFPSNTLSFSLVMSKRSVYPTVPTGSTTTDYTTGIVQSTKTLYYDFFSGEPVTTQTQDAYGNTFQTVNEPAYWYYPAMGLKLSGTGKNMLTQNARSTTYKVDNTGITTGVVAASVQTWSDQHPVFGTATDFEQAGTQSGIWRPWETFSWMPEGSTSNGFTPYPNSFIPYVAANPAAAWQKTSAIKSYNVYSNPLEVADINGRSMASKSGFDQTKMLISGGPARYQELAYSGAEEAPNSAGYFSGKVAYSWLVADGAPTSSTGSVRSTAQAHTGKWSLKVDPSKYGFSYKLNANATSAPQFHVDPTKYYRASVWVNSPAGHLAYYIDNQKVTGVSGIVQKSTADGWYLLELTIPPIGNGHMSLRVDCSNTSAAQSVYFDDFRVQPLAAQTSAYVYDERTGQVSSILNNDNLFTRYEYDAGGHLKRVVKETMASGARKVSEYTYHLARILDDARLSVDGTDVTIHVSVFAEPVQIDYDPGDGNGYRPFVNGRPYIFTVPPASATPAPAAWVRVRLHDNQGNMRELAQRVR